MTSGAASPPFRHANDPGCSGFSIAVREAMPPGPPKPKLLDRVRHATRARHYSRRTEKAYVHWIKRYIFFTLPAIRPSSARPR